jgi:nondiscriminating glutamyl-tRNA synthetase
VKIDIIMYTISMSQKVITRFPPSPTGPLHVGNVRTALFNYYFARQNKGDFIVRVEDTDSARSKKEYELSMLNGLEWLGLKKDNKEVLHQSERIDIYKKYLNKLIDENKAYISIETEGENKEVVRFRNPKKVITFEDLIRGQVSMDTTDLGDFIIARNINDPVYHLAVVVDDFEQGVTHVIRGEDHISNTPRQILIQEALGAPRPVYAHLPLILAADRSKLSKRKHGEMVSLDYYRNQGYLPEALTNFMSLLGFNPTGDQEIYSLEDFVQMFNFSKVQKSGAIFNVEKLNWFNKQYIAKLSDEDFLAHAQKFLSENNFSGKISANILSLLREKISYFGQIPEIMKTEFAFLNPIASTDKVKLAGKSDDPKNHLKKVIELISTIETFTKENVKEAVWKYAEEKGKGNVLWPMRYGLSGQDKSPDPFIISEILGKEESIQRLQAAYEIL